MTEINQETQIDSQSQETAKEINFRKQEKMYERMLEEERQKRLELENALKSKKSLTEDDEDDDTDEPYVDHKILDKKLAKFQSKLEAVMEQKAEQKARALVDEERQNNYLKENNDFNFVMSSENIQKFADKHPRLAENILRMPDGFERQKLVYENIKALGIDKPEAKQPSIQEVIDKNRKGPYYQPTGMASAPYSGGGDFSPVGQKNAYDKMRELQARLRM